MNCTTQELKDYQKSFNKLNKSLIKDLNQVQFLEKLDTAIEKGIIVYPGNTEEILSSKLMTIFASYKREVVSKDILDFTKNTNILQLEQRINEIITNKTSTESDEETETDEDSSIIIVKNDITENDPVEKQSIVFSETSVINFDGQESDIQANPSPDAVDSYYEDFISNKLTQTRDLINNINRNLFPSASNVHEFTYRKFINDLFENAFVNYKQGELVKDEDVDKNIKEYIYEKVMNLLNKANASSTGSIPKEIQSIYEYFNVLKNDNGHDMSEVELFFYPLRLTEGERTSFYDMSKVILNKYFANQDLGVLEKKYKKNKQNSEVLEYADFVIATKFDALLKAYKSSSTNLVKIKGKYKRKIVSNIREGAIFDGSVVDFNAEATELFQMLIENTPIYDSNNNPTNLYLNPKNLVYKMGNIFSDKRWKKEHPISEMREILKDLSQNVGEDAVYYKSLYKRFFELGKDSKSLASFVNGDNKLLVALVNGLQSINELRVMYIGNQEGELTIMTPEIVKKGIKNRIKNDANARFSNRANSGFLRDVYTIENIGGKYSLSVKSSYKGQSKDGAELLATKINELRQLEDTNSDTREAKLELFNLLATGSDNLGKLFFGKDFQEAAETLALINENRVEKFKLNSVDLITGAILYNTTLQELPSISVKGIAKIKGFLNDNKVFTEENRNDFILTLQNNIKKNPNFKKGDFSGLVDIYGIFGVKGGTSSGDALDSLMYIKETIFNMSPRTVSVNVDGDYTANITLQNLVGDLPAKVNRIDKENSVNADNVLASNYNIKIKQIWKKNGTIGPTDSKSHKKYSRVENIQTEVNYEYLNDINNSEKFSSFTPTVNSDKSTEQALRVNRIELFGKNANAVSLKEFADKGPFIEDQINNLKEIHFKQESSYFNKQKKLILSDLMKLAKYAGNVSLEEYKQIEDINIDEINLFEFKERFNKFLYSLIKSENLEDGITPTQRLLNLSKKYYYDTNENINIYEYIHYDPKSADFTFTNNLLFEHIKFMDSDSLAEVIDSQKDFINSYLDILNPTKKETLYKNKKGDIAVRKPNQNNTKLFKANDTINPIFNLYHEFDMYQSAMYMTENNADLDNKEVVKHIGKAEGYNKFKKNEKYTRAFITISTQGKVEMSVHPLVQRFYYESVIVSDAFKNLTTGKHYQHKGGSLSESFIGQTKRNVVIPATLHLYQQGVDDGVPEEFRVSVIEDLKENIDTIHGQEEFEIYDGSSHSTLMSMIQKRNSLGSQYGQIGGVHHKSITGALNENLGVMTMQKHNDFAMTHEKMRISRGNKVDFYQITKKLYSSIQFLEPLSAKYFDSLKYSGYSTLSYDPYTGQVKENHLGKFINENGELQTYDNKVYNNFGEIWEELGSAYNVVEDKNGDIEYGGKRYRYVDFELDTKRIDGNPILAEEVMVELKTLDYINKINSILQSENAPEPLKNKVYDGTNLVRRKDNSIVTEPTILSLFDSLKKEAAKLSMKDRFVETVAFKSAIKTGVSNINSFASLMSDDKLGITTFSSINAGIQLKSEKDYENKQGALSTQLQGAIALGSLMHEDTKQIYNYLKNITLKSLDSELSKALIQYNETPNNREIINELLSQAKKLLEVSLEGQTAASLAKDIINSVDTKDLPMDHPQLFKLISNTINSNLSKDVIKQKIAGTQMVLAPPIQVIDINGRIFTEDIFIKHLRERFEEENKVPNREEIISIVNDLSLYNDTFNDNVKIERRDLRGAETYINGTNIYDSNDVKRLFELRKVLKDRRASPEEIERASLEISDINRRIELLTKDLKSKTVKIVKNTQNSLGNYAALSAEGDILYTFTPGEMIAPPVFRKTFGIKEGTSLQDIDLNHFIKFKKERLSELSNLINKKSKSNKDISELNERYKKLEETSPEQLFENFKISNKAITARIPLQSLASIMHNEIVAYNYYEKNTTMINSKHQMLNGGDYDVDKANVSLFNVSKDGIIEGLEGVSADGIYQKMLEEPNKPVEEMTIDELKNNVILKLVGQTSSFSQLQAREKAVNMDTVDSLSNYDKVKSENNKKITPTSFTSRMEIKYQNMQGSYGIGIVATGIKSYAAISYAYHEILSNLSTGTNVTPKEAIASVFQNKGVSINGEVYNFIANMNLDVFDEQILADFLESLDLNENEDISFDEFYQSFVNKTNYSRKAYDLLGEFLNAATDNAKHLYLDKLNAGVETLGIYVSLISIGVPPEKIGEMMIRPEIEVVINTAKKNVITGSQYISLVDIATDIRDGDIFTQMIKSEGANKGKSWGQFINEKINGNNKLASEIKRLIRDYNKKNEDKKKELPSSKRKIDLSNKEDLTEYSYFIYNAIKNLSKDIVKSNENISDEEAIQSLESNKNSLFFYRTINNKIKVYSTYIRNYSEVFNLIKEKYKNKDAKIEDAGKNLTDFIDAAEFAEEFKVIGQSLGINAGLGSTEYQLYLFGERINKYFKKRKGLAPYENSGFNFYEFLSSYLNNKNDKNPEIYWRKKLREFEDVKKIFNPLRIFLENPHFEQQFLTLLSANNWSKSISGKMRELPKLLEKLRKLNYISEGTLSEYEYNKYIKSMNSLFISNYYDKSEQVIRVHGERAGVDLNLSSLEGRDDFISWMNNVFIPLISSEFSTNGFIDGLINDISKPDIFGNREQKWRLVFDHNNMTNDAQIIKENSFKDGLKKLDTTVTLEVNGEQISYNPLEMFIHYNRLVNEESMSSEAFTRFIDVNALSNEISAEVKSYWKSVSDLGKSLNANSLSEDVLINMRLDSSPIKYYDPDSVDNMGSATPKIYRKYSKTEKKQLIYVNGKPVKRKFKTVSLTSSEPLFEKIQIGEEAKIERFKRITNNFNDLNRRGVMRIIDC